MRRMIPAFLLLCAVLVGPAPTGAEVREPVLSALVTVAGPSVYDRYAALVVPAGEAATTQAQAVEVGGALRAADAEVLRAQAPVVAAARRLGVQVVSQYTTVANGLLVHATAAQLRALARTSGVVAIEPAPRVRLDLAKAVPFIGADAVARNLGFDGEGTVVAIIDTGIDYTHADFGGPGTTEAYAAANAASEVITDTWQGKALFPTEKVIGGWDFVGPNYTTPALCPPASEASGACTSTRHPDPDPLDQQFHGTHVAGIVAGEGVGTDLYHGVAPGARLVALKVYGPPGPGVAIDEEADVVVDAIEWCARVNLGLEVPGTKPPHVDAVNMSLGEPYAQGSRLFDAAVEAATGSGVIVVASAGNSGDRPYILGAPSASPKMLSVASSLPPGQSLLVEFLWADQKRTYDSLEGAITVPLRETGRLEAPLGWFGPGCTVNPPIQDVRERIALIERGGCPFSEKILNAQAAGAIAVVVFTSDAAKTSMGGDGTGVQIPGVMIDRQPGLDLQALLEAGTAVTAILDPDRDTGADGISGFSSRGPSKNGALKPDITAPGSGIVSAARGTGTGGQAASGTSMAGPMVAGTAALMAHRNRAQGLGLSALDLAALLMNYAQPVVWQAAGEDHRTVPVARQGAGRVDVRAAAGADLLVRAGEIASLYLGPVMLAEADRRDRALRLRNVSDTPIDVVVTADFLNDDDRGKGLEIRLPQAVLRVPAKGRLDVPIGFVFDPAAFRPWPFATTSAVVAEVLTETEIDGYLRVTPVDGAGQPKPDVPSARVPFYALPRRAAEVWSEGLVDGAGATPSRLVFDNPSPFPGRVELFVTPQGATADDPDEPDVAYELDLRRVGVRYDPGPGGTAAPGTLAFGVARHESAAIPQSTLYEVYLDTDDDGAINRRVRAGGQGTLTGQGSDDRTVVVVGTWNPISATVSAELQVGDFGVDLHTRVAIIRLPLAALGLTGPTPLSYYVVHRGLNEDWLHTPATDVAPDGADAGPGAPRYRFDAASLARVPEAWSVTVPGGQTADLDVASGAGTAAEAFLALYPDNTASLDGAQAQVIVPGELPPPPPGPPPVFLPVVVRTHALRPPPPADETIRTAFEKLDRVERLRLTYDLSMAADPAREAQRQYTLDADEGMHLVTSWRSTGTRFEFLRYRTIGFASDYQQGNWRCAPIDEHMLLWSEMRSRLRREYPLTGWAVDEDNGTTARLRQTSPDGQLELRATIDVASGLPTALTRREGSSSRPTRIEVYNLERFDDPSIIVRPPGGVRCL